MNINPNVRGTRAWLTLAETSSAIEILRHMIQDCERFYTWPALVDSWKFDLLLLDMKLDMERDVIKQLTGATCRVV
jgi:hypothetical protein